MKFLFKKNNINEFLNKNKSYIIAAFFAIIYIFGIACVPLYGVNYDVNSENYILMTDLKAYAKVLSPQLCENVSTFTNLPDIQNYKEKDHGKAAFYPVGAFRLIAKPATSNYIKLYSAYNFTINFAGLVFLYLCGRLLLGKRRYALIASAFYILNPRIFADFYYNDKDLVFSSFLIISAYFAFKIVLSENRKCLYAALAGFFAAFACNTRIIGAFLPFLIFAFYIVCMIKKGEYKNAKSYLPAIVAVVTFAAVFILITPATWYGLFDYISYTLKSSSDFTRWNGTVYYFGNYYSAEQGVPWHYLPVLMICTTPLPIVLFSVLGFAFLIYNSIKTKIKTTDYLFLILIASSALPLLFAIISGSRVYNGWRHFYFVYPAAVLCGAYCVKYLFAIFKNKKRAFLNAAVALCVAFCCVNAALCIPHGYAYCSMLSDNIEADYWNISAQECVKNLLEQTDENIVITYSDAFSGDGINNAVQYLPANLRERVTLTGDVDAADYIYVNPMYYDITKNCGTLLCNTEQAQKCTEVMLYGRALSEIYYINRNE